jgi:transcriptional regulator with XRE-family HTH domain
VDARKFEPDKTTAAERVVWLLRKLWGGSQTKMAADTGISQTAISNVITGRRAPGRKFLLAVASHPLVSAAWLLTGEGDRLLALGSESASNAPMLPVASRLLLGPIHEHREHLSGTYMPVSRPDFARSRYWLHVTTSEWARGDVAAGDALLVETDPVWLQNLSLIQDHLCVWIDRQSEPHLDRLKFDPEMKVLVGRTSAPAPVESRLVPFSYSSERHRKIVRNKKGPSAQAHETNDETRNAADKSDATARRDTVAAPPTTVPADAVVGVGVLLQRRWPWR